MAKQIPPKSFFRLSQSQQVDEAVKQADAFYALYEQWKHIARDARKKHIVEPEIDRPDEAQLKDL